MSAGYDFRWIDGDSNERTYALATGLTPLLNRISGGTQKIGGFFVQDIIEVTRQAADDASVRFDSWRNYDAHNFENDDRNRAPDAEQPRVVPDKSDTPSARAGRCCIARAIASACGAASARDSARRH